MSLMTMGWTPSARGQAAPLRASVQEAADRGLEGLARPPGRQALLTAQPGPRLEAEQEVERLEPQPVAGDVRRQLGFQVRPLRRGVARVVGLQELRAIAEDVRGAQEGGDLLEGRGVEGDPE